MFLAKNKTLLHQFREGHKEALETVYKHYAPGVKQFLRKGFTFQSAKAHFYFKGITEEADLDAAVQEVFRRVFEDKARLSYNGVNSFTNWVLAVARNLVINQFRNREIAFSNYVSAQDERGHLAVIDDEVTEEFSGLLYGLPALMQDKQVEQQELTSLVSKFMKELTQEEREILTLRFAEGLGQEETAKAIGSTRMKVRTIEAKLRVKLRSHLKHTGYIDQYPKIASNITDKK